MVRILKHVGLLLFFILLYSLTLFFVSPDYHSRWAAIGLILFVLWVPLTYRLIPSRRRDNMMTSLSTEYTKIRKTESEIRENARTLSLICPACQEANNYWTFLDKTICPKCGSGLWSTVVVKEEESYAKLLRRKEIVDTFYAKIPSGLLRKLKILALQKET